MGTLPSVRPRREQPAPASPSGGAGSAPVNLVTAVVPASSLDALRDAVVGAGATGMTVTEVGGHGRQSGETGTYRGAEYPVDFLPRLSIETLVLERDVPRVVNALLAAAGDGKAVDGKIWVTPVESVTRIRTGECGPDAL